MIAYDKENIHHHHGKYDLIIDTHGNLFHSDYKRMGQRGVMVGFTTLGHMISLLLKRAISKFPLNQFTAEANTKDLETLASLIQNGKIKTHIEKTYSYKQIPEAIGYIEAMRTRGKVAMVWQGVEDTAEVDVSEKAHPTNSGFMSNVLSSKPGVLFFII